MVCVVWGNNADAALGQRDASPIPISYFTSPPQFRDAALSPNGRYRALLTIENDQTLLVITDLDAPDDRPSALLEPGGNLGFNGVTWASNNRLLVSLPILIKKSGYRGFGTRLMAMSPAGDQVVELVSPDGNDRYVAQDHIIDLLPEDPQHILMAVGKSDARKPEVHKVNIYTGKSVRIEPSRNDVSDWMTDHNGTVRLSRGYRNKNYVVKVRDPGKTRWNTLWTAPGTSTDQFVPISFLNNPEKMLVASNHEGGPSAVYQYDISKRAFERRVFGHPKVDVEHTALIDPINKRVLGLEYVLDGSEMHYLDANTAAIAADLERALPGKQIRILSIAANGNRVIAYAGSPTDPGRYYIYDQYERALREFGQVNPYLDEHLLSPMEALTYRTRDNVSIAAYLTLPRGVDRTSHPFLPTIILPHGGPTARDWLRYDYQVQFLASRGYAVLQMNFRGSSGYGADFQESGYKQWGQAMQDDITDGVTWLVNQGIADPNRICIFGGSYGGYAALMGAVKTPKLYRCAVSFNGVSDLGGMVDYATDTMGQQSIAHIGDARTDQSMLDEYSPLKRVDEIEVPVLLIAGTWDTTVPFEQSQAMAAALKSANKDYEFLVLERAGHSLNSRRYRNRFLTELEVFLAKHLRP